MLVILSSLPDASEAAQTAQRALAAAARPTGLRFAVPEACREGFGQGDALFYSGEEPLEAVLPLLTDETFFLHLMGAHGFAPKWDARLYAALRHVCGPALLSASVSPPVEGTPEPVADADADTRVYDRAALGGEEYLDGFAVYDTGKDYQHIVTYGLSELYPSMAAFGSEYSKWGYELTLKVRESYAETGTWALYLLAHLARYTFQTGNYFEPGAYIPGDGGSLHPELNSAITALAIVSDTTAAPIETVHGRVAFLQLIGLTQPELDAITRDPDALTGILERMRAEDPELVLDMRRTRSYI